MTTYPNHRKYLKFALAARQSIDQSFSEDDVEALSLELAGWTLSDFRAWRTDNSHEVDAFLEVVSSASSLSELTHPQLKIRLAGYHVLSEAVSLLSPLIESLVLEVEDSYPGQIRSLSEVYQKSRVTLDAVWPFGTPCPFQFK
ncbi:hypothetical protein HG263_06765 [Pseudoalteromonas sp. JBTF-M23]|uniref:Uncharacterized protein n=1 Tax=Pseudoalteromonas caenipelagi TaxID=2726988 RepID=A0A849VE80_9GAMM|nr:hypothetical protein [Pseudoalteromonas caenipelagi]NOU50244.1 hypothetical protein [Pseudoalteromonas caenipelagi]